MQTPRLVRDLRNSFRNIRVALGMRRYMRTEDRRIMEKVIFPYFVSASEYSKILFVGCDWYTRWYNTIFRYKDYRTLEIDPVKEKYGAKKHIVDGFENVADHFDEGELDLIICNGVFGWGLSERAGVEKAFEGCFRCLRQGGIFVLGWNDIPAASPFPLDESQSLKLFQPFVFPPLSTAEYRTGTSNRHTYNFYIKQT